MKSSLYFAPKRKALDAGSARSSKRSTPAPGTPVSLTSDDDYEGSDTRSQDDASDSEKEHIRKARARLDFSAFQGSGSKRKQAPSIFGEKDFSWLSLKTDHENRPLWIDPGVSTGSKKGPKITLEAFSPLAAQATDLLTTIAEPQSRPSYLHEYRFTEHSLYAALSVGLRGEDIIRALEKLSKTPVPETVIEFINRHTKTYGKVRLVLRNNKFYVESDERPIIDMLLKDPVIGPCKSVGTDVQVGRIQTKATVIQGTSNAKGVKQAGESNVEMPRDDPSKENEAMIAALRDEEDEEDTYKEAPNFEIGANKRDVVAKQCLDIGYPAISEYDFAGDHENPTLPIDLRPSTSIRPYQERALSKMFGNGRGKSGIIVLPCGAGKTLVGITAGCHIKKSIVVLCTSAMSSYQWANEFKKWSDIKEEDIAVFSANEKRRFTGNAGVLVTTYSMITAGGKRAYDTQQMMDWVYGKEWGLMILDEVHVVPAKMFRKVGENIRAHCKLGLTATLLREDDKITDLNFIIGPKLYEANWMELADQGHIAKVQCAEVWCPMSMEFYQEYQKETTRKQALYYIMNPVKYQVCQYLIDYHEKRGDKIIVFSDNLFALKHYAISMKKPFIYGDTSNQERISILENFQHNEMINTIFLSKIGDTSLDLPEATCLIQISSHYGSRRQEAQRLGRILRAKRRNDEGFNAFFYSLVSKDTTEMAYSAKRQAFLVDQGYAFKTITHLAGMAEMKDLAYRTSAERNELLALVMLQQETAADVEKIDDNMWSHLSAGNKPSAAAKKRLQVRRQAVLMADASGGGTMAPMYREQERRSKKSQIPESEWFKKEARRRELAAKKRKKEQMDAQRAGDA
ncbi:DNA excision repair protein ERCC-3 [Exophiala viscosa]|uniref:DNA 3'-5' helicase n=1 Tax=Exophiala viscosa TaxID=2486360 RepID=A0AAN6E198_9EURO|nr:DNA excision repair protein ERCC-3 [Exophiala viscosa]